MYKTFHSYVSDQLTTNATTGRSQQAHTYTSVDQHSVQNFSEQHFNPIHRSKLKFDERRSGVHSETQQSHPQGQSRNSGDARVESSRAVSEVYDFSNLRQECRSKDRGHGKLLQAKIQQLVERVENNERQIQKLSKACEKQNYSLKILSDFKEVKDIYNVIRDQKNVQAEVNKKMNQEINQFKLTLTNLKHQLQKPIKHSENAGTKLQADLQKFVKTKIEKKFEQVNPKIAQLHLITTQLSKKISTLQHNFSLTSALTRIRTLSPTQSTTPNPTPLTITYSSETKQGNPHPLSKLTYHIDKNGYLLDENKYYILDQNDQMIKVCEATLQKLREVCQDIVQQL